MLRRGEFPAGVAPWGSPVGRFPVPRFGDRLGLALVGPARGAHAQATAQHRPYSTVVSYRTPSGTGTAWCTVTPWLPSVRIEESTATNDV